MIGFEEHVEFLFFGNSVAQSDCDKINKLQDAGWGIIGSKEVTAPCGRKATRTVWIRSTASADS